MCIQCCIQQQSRICGVAQKCVEGEGIYTTMAVFAQQLVGSCLLDHQKLSVPVFARSLMLQRRRPGVVFHAKILSMS